MTDVSTVPAMNAGLSYISGFMLEYIDGTRISVGSGQLRDSTNTNDIFMNKDVEISILKNGVGGLDTGGVIPSAIYAVYVVGDSLKTKPTDCLISLNRTHPVLPGGYNVFRRLGFIYVDGTASIDAFHQVGGYNSTERRMCFDDLFFGLGGGTALVWTTVDLSAFIPLEKCMVDAMVGIAPAGPGDLLHLRTNGSQSSLGTHQITGVVAGILQREMIQMPINNYAVDYYVEAAPGFAEAFIVGYLDSL